MIELILFTFCLVFSQSHGQQLNHICSTCVWSNNLGYANDPTDCSKYIVCVRSSPQSEDYIFWIRDCAPSTFWNQEFLTCTRDIPSEENCTLLIIQRTIPPFEACQLLPAPRNDQYFFVGELRTCPQFTQFVLEKCACLTVDNPICDRSVPQLTISFENGVNDDSCNKAVGEVTGNIKLNNFGPEGGTSAHFDGSSFIQYASLANRGPLPNIGIGLYFETGTLAANALNQSLISTSGCIDPPSYELFIGPNNNIHGVIRGETGTVNLQGSYIPSPINGGAGRKKRSTDGFNHCFLVYDGSMTILYINGLKVMMVMGAVGDVKNNKCGSSIGFSSSGDPFKGNMDDVRYYERPLAQAEIQQICKCP